MYIQFLAKLLISIICIYFLAKFLICIYFLAIILIYIIICTFIDNLTHCIYKIKLRINYLYIIYNYTSYVSLQIELAELKC